jgi:hypothetical protein
MYYKDMETNYTKKQNYPFVSQNTVPEKVDYIETVSYLHINSSDRNVTAYPSVNSYKIDTLFKNIKNIRSIELIAGSIPNVNSVLLQPYLILKIDGLNHITFSNKNINSGFAMMYLQNTSGAFIQPELGVLQRNVLNFKTPLASLSNINLQILKPDGTLFSFGESAGDVSVTYSTSFTLRIISIEKSRKDLNNRVIF